MSQTQLTDFETKNMMCHLKMVLTEHTLNQYAQMQELLTHQKLCENTKCEKLLDNADPSLPNNGLDPYLRCVKDCSTGMREVLKMQKQHSEITRLTFGKNIARCL